MSYLNIMVTEKIIIKAIENFHKESESEVG